MRLYEVQPGDSPASIASRDDMAGCPRCAIDLVRANPHKETVTYPNGFVTFKELAAGEKLSLPDKWWTKEFDALPPSYFASLPYADGVTPGALSAPPYSAELIAAAKASDAALGVVNDSGADYCVDVARVGSPVNRAVHAFKLLWNATESPPVPINTGNYEQATSHAITLVLGSSYDPCPPRTASAPRPPQPTVVAPLLPAPKKEELSTGAIVGISLLGAGAVGGAVYLASRPRGRR